MDPQFLANLESILDQLTNASADSARIRSATATLNSQYFSTPTCVPALVHLLQKSQSSQVRQLAAVELRKRCSKYWLALENPVREQIKEGLLQCILQEPENLVRHSTARVISAVAKVEVPAQRWNNLIQFLHSCCQAPIAGQREVGYFVLFTLFDVVGEAFAEYMQELLAMFGRGLQDPESKEVRVTTLQALGKVSEYIEPENKQDVAAFRQLIPAMVGVIQQALNDCDEDTANKGFEVFDGLLILEAPLLANHIAELIDFFLSAAANVSYDGTLRCMALNFLTMVVVYQKTKVQRLKLVTSIISRIFPIAAEEDAEDPDEDAPSKLAVQVIDSLSRNLPPQQVFPIVLEHINAYMQNPEPKFRKAAMLAFAVQADGCADYIRDRISELIPLVQHGLQDPSDIVRRAACLALGCLAEELPEEVCANHVMFLPLIFSLMNDPNEEIKKHACNALDAVLEGLAGDIVTYLDPLMEKLISLVDVVQGELKGTVIAAIGSAAHAAGDRFQPYFLQVIVRLQQMMSQTDTKNSDAMLHRGVATDTVGAIADAVGKETFRPYIADFMNLAAEGLHLESGRLRECSYCLFAVMARVYGSEFTPYLEHVVPHLIKSCQLDETVELDPVARAESTLLNSQHANSKEEDIEIENDDDEGERTFNISSAIADEKEIAADALGEIFESLEANFLPYVTPTVDELVKLTDHHSEGVRKSAMGSLFKYLSTFHKLSHDPKWVPGLPVRIAVHENVLSMIQLVIPAVLRMWKDEDDKAAVQQICTEMESAINLVGPAVLADHVDEIAQNCVEIFEKKALCQLESGDEEGELDEDEQAEQDSLIIGSAGDLVTSLAKALGKGFEPYMKVFYGKISKYYKKSLSVADRSMAVGCISECVDAMGRSITAYTSDLLALYDKALGDEAPDVRSNAVFGLGVLVQNSDVDLSGHYPALLTRLSSMFHNQSLWSVADNACGAVARMILKRPDAIPIDQVLPVLLQALPLKADFAENIPVFKCLFGLIKANNPTVFSHLARVLSISAYVLSSEEQLTDTTREELLAMVRHVRSSYQETFFSALCNVSPEEREIVQQLVQGQ